MQQEVEEPIGDDKIIKMEPLFRAESGIVAHLATFLVKPVLSAVQPCRVCTQMLTAEEASEEHTLVLMKKICSRWKTSRLRQPGGRPT